MNIWQRLLLTWRGSKVIRLEERIKELEAIKLLLENRLEAEAVIMHQREREWTKNQAFMDSKWRAQLENCNAARKELNQALDLLKTQLEPYPAPHVIRKITNSEVEALIRGRIKWINNEPIPHIPLQDAWYDLVSVGAIDKFYKQSKTAQQKYEAEKFDCGKYVRAFLGELALAPGWSDIPCGQVWWSFQKDGVWQSEAGILFVADYSDDIHETGVWRMIPQPDNVFYLMKLTEPLENVHFLGDI